MNDLSSQYTDLFSKPKQGSYLLTHSIGLPLVSNEQCIKNDFLNAWRHTPEEAWPMWLSAVEQFKSSLASLLKCDANSLCPQSNVSSGLSKVLSALPNDPDRNVIVLSENDFPSASFVLQQARRLGYSIKLIPKSLDHCDLDVWSAYLNEHVCCVLITHVHYNTSTCVPVNDISALAKSHGVISIVDIAQSVGIIPIDLSEWSADVVVGSCIKWLCGGPGGGFLWIHSDLVPKLEPLDLGWFSHKNPFEFDLHNFEYADDASRFWGGTPSVLPYIIANNSILQMNEIGVETIRSHNLALSQLMVDTVDPNHLISPSDLSKKGGTTVIKTNDQPAFESYLKEANILFDSREFGVRVSPHIYTSKADIELLLSCVNQTA